MKDVPSVAAAEEKRGKRGGEMTPTPPTSLPLLSTGMNLLEPTPLLYPLIHSQLARATSLWREGGPIATALPPLPRWGGGRKGLVSRLPTLI